MTIAKGAPWGQPGALPPGGIVAASDAEVREAVEGARRSGLPLPVVGLLGGDLCKTVGGRGDVARLRSPDAVTFPVDIARVQCGDGVHWFVAHLVARNRLWTRSTLVMNAAWLGAWNAAPRSHPNDGLLDVLAADLRPGDLPAVRARLPHGAHVPHPRIRQSRVASLDLVLPPRTRVWLDGSPIAAGARLCVTVESDALSVVV